MQRYFAAGERRNYFVTRLVAEIAENYYGLMALDKRLENLDKIIALQEQSLEIAKARLEAARGTELAVQRFLAEVRKNQSEKLIVKQDIIEVENRINFLVGRFPQPVERMSAGFSEFYRSELARAERRSARAAASEPTRHPPGRARAGGCRARREGRPGQLLSSAGHHRRRWLRGLQSEISVRTPEALVANVAGDLVAPLINKKAIKADYLTANARQLQAVYNYQRVILNAFTEVVNRLSKVQNYSRSIEIKKQQVESARGLSRSRHQTFSECPTSNTSTCSSPSVTSGTREWS